MATTLTPDLTDLSEAGISSLVSNSTDGTGGGNDADSPSIWDSSIGDGDGNGDGFVLPLMGGEDDGAGRIADYRFICGIVGECPLMCFFVG